MHVTCDLFFFRYQVSSRCQINLLWPIQQKKSQFIPTANANSSFSEDSERCKKMYNTNEVKKNNNKKDKKETPSKQPTFPHIHINLRPFFPSVLEVTVTLTQICSAVNVKQVNIHRVSRSGIYFSICTDACWMCALPLSDVVISLFVMAQEASDVVLITHCNRAQR